MKPLTSYVPTLLILVAIICIDAKGSQVDGQTRVTLADDLGDNFNLSIHCHSEACDLGNQIIEYGQRYHYFAVDRFYTCHFAWFWKTGTFPIYDFNRDNQRCHGWCFWRVSQDGLYLLLPNPPRFVMQFRWN